MLLTNKMLLVLYELLAVLAPILFDTIKALLRLKLKSQVLEAAFLNLYLIIAPQVPSA